jgi:hypothetical protein
MCTRIALQSATLALLFAAAVHAEILSGPISHWPESEASFSWGDGVHDLYEDWSVRVPDSQGYVYGTQYYPFDANADVANAGPIQAWMIPDASVYSYSTTPITFTEGDLLLFRGLNGYYGAWKTLDVYPNPTGAYPHAYLDGTWYFQSDGSPNLAPEPSGVTTIAAGMLLASKRRRQPNTIPSRKRLRNLPPGS